MIPTLWLSVAPTIFVAQVITVNVDVSGKCPFMPTLGTTVTGCLAVVFFKVKSTHFSQSFNSLPNCTKTLHFIVSFTPIYIGGWIQTSRVRFISSHCSLSEMKTANWAYKTRIFNNSTNASFRFILEKRFIGECWKIERFIGAFLTLYKSWFCPLFSPWSHQGAHV